MTQDRASARAVRGSFDVAIVGGGVIGLACAWRIAQRGHSVAVVDPEPGRGASWAAAGMLAPVTEVHYGEEALLELNLASAERYPSFVAELTEDTGDDVGYRRSGTVIVARDRDDNAALDAVFAYQRELGLEVERLSGRDCRTHEPALSPRVRGGIHVAGDHQVDNRALVKALISACTERGVEFVRARAERIQSASGRTTGVITDADGIVSTERVVLAMGAVGARIAGTEEAGLPKIRPVKGQLIHLRGEIPLLHGNVRGLDVYLVGRSDGRVVVGATVEEQGFDLKITAGAMHDLLRAAYELVPGITELEVIETTAGLRPATPDNAPVLGPTSLEGLSVATGHYRNGVLLSAISADAIADVVESGRVPRLIEPFLPSRFARAGSLR
jgi:glycine oxidase